MKSAFALPLYVVGALLEVAGLMLFLGNTTGLWPSFPFAGAITMTTGGVLHLIATAILQGLRQGPVVERKPTSIVVTSLALLLFLPLNLGSWVWVGNSISEGKDASSTGIALAVTAFLTLLIYLLIRNAVLWVRARPA